VASGFSRKFNTRGALPPEGGSHTRTIHQGLQSLAATHPADSHHQARRIPSRTITATTNPQRIARGVNWVMPPGFAPRGLFFDKRPPIDLSDSLLHGHTHDFEDSDQ
jgi:hypothetical protein